MKTTIEIGHKITDLVANTTGEYMQTANRIAVTKGQVCKAAAMLGGPAYSECTHETYKAAYNFLSAYIAKR